MATLHYNFFPSFLPPLRRLRQRRNHRSGHKFSSVFLFSIVLFPGVFTILPHFGFPGLLILYFNSQRFFLFIEILENKRMKSWLIRSLILCRVRCLLLFMIVGLICLRNRFFHLLLLFQNEIRLFKHLFMITLSKNNIDSLFCRCSLL